MINKARAYYSLALLAYFGLLAVTMLWNTLLYPSAHFPVALLLILVSGPLLLPLRGLLHVQPRSFAWAAYLSIAYFMHGSVEAYVNPIERTIAWLEILFSLLLFVSSILVIRCKPQ